MVFHEQGQNDRLKIMLVDYLETSSHLVSILENQFKSNVWVVSDQDNILDNLKQNPNLIIIVDKRTGELGPVVGRFIRKIERVNGFHPTSIITLLSDKTFIKANSINVSDIIDYHMASQSKEGLQSIIGEWMEKNAKETKLHSEATSDFDPKMIEELILISANDFNSLVDESIELYFDQYKESVQNIKDMWLKNEPDRLREIAHFMKSSSFTMGANEVAYLFSSLEQAVLKDKLELEEKISQIDKSFERAQKKLLTYYHINK